MRKSMLYSLVGIIAVAVAALGFTLAEGHKPLLGLDLQGGASVVLQPQTKVDKSVLDQAISIIRRRVDAIGVAEPDISRQGQNVVIQLPGIKDPANALRVVGQTAQLLFRPVLCSTGGNVSTFPPYSPAAATPAPTTTVPGSTSTTVASTSSTTQKVGLGPSGGRMPSAALPSAALPAAAPSQTPVPTVPGAPVPTVPGAPVPTVPGVPVPTVPGAPVPGAATTTGPGGASTTTATTAPVGTGQATGAAPAYSDQYCAVAASPQAGALPTTPSAQDVATATVLLPGADKAGNADKSGPRYLLGPAELTGKVVATATALPPDIANGQPNWFVQVKFTSAGGPQFDTLAKANFQKNVAIVLDGVVESAPQIQQQSFSGSAVINGSNFTEGTAKNLALELRYGSLPVEFQAQSIETVSATIGKDSLRAGLLAGSVGLILVLAYMLLYYRALGVVVVLGLSLSGMLLYSIISQLSQSSGLSLSLAGATGIIVSVGVTADSYIVYFERLKDEIRSGKSVRSSVDRGFSRAYRTIVAADLVSIMAALILYLFTVGSVRGFAFFLGLSTILDLITAYFFTRPMVALLGRNRVFTEARFFGVARGLAAAPSGGAT